MVGMGRSGARASRDSRRREAGGQKLRAALGVLVALAASCVAVASPPQAESEVRARHRLLREALDRNDWRALERLLHRTYVSTNSDGTLATKAELIELLRGLHASLPAAGGTPSEQSEERDVDIRVYDRTAVITGLVETLLDREVTLQLRFTEVWIQDGHEWVAVAWHGHSPEATTTVTFEVPVCGEAAERGSPPPEEPEGNVR
jgi:hypothetical protein